MGVVRALEIERLKPVEGGVYVCTDVEKGTFELVTPEKLFIDINGQKRLLGEVLFSLIQAQNKLIDILITNNNNTEVK